MSRSDVDDSPDPDPTPTATPWQEYLAAAQSLDVVVREATAGAAAMTRASGPARVELARLWERLDRQRAWLVGEAVRAGLPSPPLVPTPAERAAAGGVAGGVAEALRQCHQLLDLADAQLAPDRAPASPAPGPPTLTGMTGPVVSGVPMVSGVPVTPGASVAAGVPTPAGGLPQVRTRSAPDRVRAWSPPLWLIVALPLGTAAVVVCVLSILLAVLT